MRSLSRSIFFILFIIRLISPHSANATHAFGAQLTYTNLDANRYIITYTLYRDCSGIFPASTVMINISNSCGFPPQSFSIPQVTTPLALIPACPNDNPTTCAGGIHMGIEKYVYSVRNLFRQLDGNSALHWDLPALIYLHTALMLPAMMINMIMLRVQQTFAKNRS